MICSSIRNNTLRYAAAGQPGHGYRASQVSNKSPHPARQMAVGVKQGYRQVRATPIWQAAAETAGMGAHTLLYQPVRHQPQAPASGDGIALNTELVNRKLSLRGG